MGLNQEMRYIIGGLLLFVVVALNNNFSLWDYETKELTRDDTRSLMEEDKETTTSTNNNSNLRSKSSEAEKVAMEDVNKINDGTAIKEEESDKRVHIVQAAENEEYMQASATSIHSILQNTPTPHLVTIHIFVQKKESNKDGNDDESLKQYQKLYNFVTTNFDAQLELHEYTYDEVAPFINNQNMYTDGNLKTPGNYVRFILTNHLSPTIQRCLWIDSDTATLKDIVPFLQKYGKEEKAISAVARNFDNIGQEARTILKQHGVAVSPRPTPSFNAGIMVFNLQYWRDHNVMDQIRYICKLNEEYNLYPRFGSQPPLQILFSGKDMFEPIEADLVVNGLGWDGTDAKHQEIERNTTLFLHWNGDKKPWLENGLHKHVWDKFIVSEG